MFRDSSVAPSASSNMTDLKDPDEKLRSDRKAGKRRLMGFFRIFYLLKLVAWELLLYLVCYYAINVVYRFVLNQQQQEDFTRVVDYLDQNLKDLSRDLTFLMGFYVSLVAKRWWDQYRLLPWPDNLAMLLSGLVEHRDADSDSIRHTIVRYALLSYVLCIRRFSTDLQRHFKTTQDIMRIGLLRPNELTRLKIKDMGEHGDDEGDEKERGVQQILASNWWLPIVWAINITKLATIHKKIPSDRKEVLRELMRFRGGLEAVESHVTVTIPLVYKLVVTTAVYAYFVLTLVGNQSIGLGQQHPIDLYFPVFIVFKLILMVGWLKVAQAIEKPFDEDDADFEMYLLVKRHIRATNVILNEFDDVPGALGKILQEHHHGKPGIGDGGQEMEGSGGERQKEAPSFDGSRLPPIHQGRTDGNGWRRQDSRGFRGAGGGGVSEDKLSQLRDHNFPLQNYHQQNDRSTLKLNAPPAAGLLPPNSLGSLGDEHFLASSEDGEAADGMRPPGGVWSQTGEERSAIWGAPRGGRGGRNF